MSDYYLPIKINQRRIHICRLSSETASRKFEFIIPNDAEPGELFSIPSDAILASSSGTSNDKKTINLGYAIAGVVNETDNSEIDITIVFGKMDTSENKAYKAHNLSIKREASSDDFIARTSEQLSLKKINVELVYRQDQNDECKYSFVLHTPKTLNKEVEIYDGAIDFGSEASQVGIKKYNENARATEMIKVVKVLKDFHKQYDEETFWQGSPEDESEDRFFLKSFFFANKAHSGYKYADRPNRHKEHTFLKTLLPHLIATPDEATNIYRSLYLLPNLKLFELLPLQTLPENDMNFSRPGNNPRKYYGPVPILSTEMIEDYIRLILNNLLYTILKRLNVNEKDRYLNIVLLMPNVYAQSKVYRLVSDFYEDFNNIVQDKSNREFSNFKGIEVQVMSESDASFFGTRFSPQKSGKVKIKTSAGANYLVIDAGKGTTDFSILKQQDETVIYDSIFRTGLPGSGEILTYAFIEALNDILPADVYLDKLVLSEKSYIDIYDFMEIMEKFKTHHEAYKDSKTALITEKFETLRNLNVYLDTHFIKLGLRLPLSDAKLKTKVDYLVDKIAESISQSGISTFQQIIFAGRTVKLKKLRDALVARFGGHVTEVSEADGFAYDEEYLKSGCVRGAFEKQFGRINFNSELIGIPVVTDKDNKLVQDLPEKKNFFAGLISAPQVVSGHSLSSRFFFHGKNIKWANDLTIKIGAVDYKPRYFERNPNPAGNDTQVCNIFYAGDSFWLRWENSAVRLEEGSLPEQFTEMVKETLFPFAYLNFGDPEKAKYAYFSMKKTAPPVDDKKTGDGGTAPGEAPETASLNDRETNRGNEIDPEDHHDPLK